MPQIIRPDADTTRLARRHLGQTRDSSAALESLPYVDSGQTPSLRGTTSMNAIMSGTAPVSANYIDCPLGSYGDVFVVGLGNPETTPNDDYNHIIRVVASKDSSGGAAVGVVCELRQGYTSETSLGTLIASFVCTDAPATVDTYYRYRLTTTEAALITDYTDLQLRFVTLNARGGAPRTLRLHWAEVELPNVSDGARDQHLSSEELRRKERGLAVTQESDRQTTGSTSRN